MSFLKRLLGNAQPRSTMPSRNTHMQVNIWSPDHTRGDARVDVVGEQYHAQAVELFRLHAGSRAAKAVLMRQPDNPKDANAIAVLVYTREDQAAHVGYLAREDASAYRPVFDFLGDRVLGCEAAVAPYRGGAGTDGVVLHLGTPGELIADLWAETYSFADHRWRDKSVAFTGYGLSLANVTLDRQGQLLLARLAGVIVAPRITKKADVLVVGDSTETTATSKAREYGIPVLEEQQFWVELGIPEGWLSKGLGRWAQPRERSWR
jgi:NAD-dependent DNA ligase